MSTGAASASGDYLGQPAGADSGPASRALDDLYRDHSTQLRRYIAGRFGAGPPEPEEVAQAAFAKLAAQDVERIKDPLSYLFTIARNIVFEHHRQARSHAAVARDLKVRDENLSEISPETVLLDRERLAVFQAAVKAMPAMRRRIFLLVRVEGETPKDLARRFAVSESAIRKQVARGLADCIAAFERAERRWRRNR